jgi:methylmalonyl-CoA/ethylmalonyl-CoA epimerase
MNGVGIRRLGQLAVTVQDVERARDFYRDVLGLAHLFDAPPGLSFFDLGGVRLMLSRPESGEHDHPSSIMYLDVPDIAASHGALRDRGVVFEQDPHFVADLGDRELWLAFFRDSESNFVALMSELAKAH